MKKIIILALCSFSYLAADFGSSFGGTFTGSLAGGLLSNAMTRPRERVYVEESAPVSRRSSPRGVLKDCLQEKDELQEMVDDLKRENRKLRRENDSLQRDLESDTSRTRR